MKKLKWILLGVVVVIAYLQIGYLFAYSTDSGAKPTVISEIVYKIVDFGGVVGKASGVSAPDYGVFMFFWPLLLAVYWVANSAILLWNALWNALIWLFTGGIFRWLGWIK